MNALRQMAARRWFGSFILLPLLVLALLAFVLAVADSAQAADQLRFTSDTGEWAVTSGVADGNIGKVKATGPNNASRIRYAISGHPAFSITPRGGRVIYDGSPITDGSVQLTATARDRRGKWASASLVLEVSVSQPVRASEPPPQRQMTTNTAPTFNAGETAARSVAENSASGTNVGAALAVTNTESDTLTFALSGSDAFTIDGSGQVKVASGASLDHEAQDRYSLSVTVHDGKNAAGEADTSVDDTITVTVSVTNVDEDGTVTFDVNTPWVGTALRASVEDPDGAVSGLAWSWARADARDGAFTPIAGAASPVYYPGADDVGKWLRATASYTDPEGPSKSAQAATTNSGRMDPVPPGPTAPKVSTIAVTSTPMQKSDPAITTPDTYGKGEAIDVTVTFDKAVTVTGVPSLRLMVGSSVRAAAYASGSGSAALVFTYTVVDRDRDDNGVSIGGGNPVVLPADGGIVGSDGKDADLGHAGLGDQTGHKVDARLTGGSAPRITSISIVSTPASGDTYGAGETIEFLVKWNQMVVGLNQPYPSLNVRLGSGMKGSTDGRTSRIAISNADVSRFRYTVQAGDQDTDGVSIPADPLVVPAGSFILNPQNNADAVLTYAGLAAQSGHKVNGGVDNVRPVKPTNLNALPAAAEQPRTWISLTWRMPAGDDTITGYQYRRKVGAGSWGEWTDLPSGTVDQTSHKFDSNLTRGTTYTFRVRAKDSAGAGPASDEVTVTIPNAVAADTTGLTGSDGPNSGQVTLTWSDPGDASITGFQYRWARVHPSKTSEFDYIGWTDIEDSDKYTTEHTVSDLMTDGSLYYFRVRAVNAQGPGGQSNTVIVTPEAEEATGQPQLAGKRGRAVSPPAAPVGFTVKATRFTSLGFIAGAQISWDNPNNAAITGWELRVSPALRDWPYQTWTPIPDSGPDTTSHVVTGLRNGSVHSFELRAVAGEVKGAASAAGTLDLKNHMPTGLTATAIEGGVRLQWDDAASHAGHAITGWESSWAVVGNTPWEAVSGHTVADGIVSFTIDHKSDNRLNPYIELETYFRIRAVYANGQRGYLVTVSATPIPIPRPAAPPPPVANGSVKLSWHIPAWYGGEPEHWQYRYWRHSSIAHPNEPSDYGTWKTIPAGEISAVRSGDPYTYTAYDDELRRVATFTSYDTTYTWSLTGLFPGDSYRIQVRPVWSEYNQGPTTSFTGQIAKAPAE